MSRPATDVSELARRYLEGIGRLGERTLVLDLPRDEAVRLAGRIGEGARMPDDPGEPEADVHRRASGGKTGEVRDVTDLDSLRAMVERCTRCPLHKTRTNAVFGEGDEAARVVCVGEAPGAVEDETGRPFVGRAGKLLDRLLMTIGLPREWVFICNVLKSRPPNNRDPLPEEVQACSPYLRRQLELIDPDVILAFGAFAARTLLESKAALGKLRGTVHQYAGYPLVATYHPAALLRNPGWTRATWEDLQLVRRILDGDREGMIGRDTSSTSAADVRPGDAAQPEIFG